MRNLSLFWVWYHVVELRWPIAVCFFLVGWVPMFVMGRPLIAGLKGLRGMTWSTREGAPSSLLSKAGTPSMGGIGLVGSALLGLFSLFVALKICTVVLFHVPGWNFSLPGYRSLEPMLILVLGLAVLGCVDDWSKASGCGGLRAWIILFGKIGLATYFVSLVLLPRIQGSPVHWYAVATPWPIVLVVMVLLIVGTVNAVNFTDGVDGLAAGLWAQCGLVYLLWSIFHDPGHISSSADESADLAICLGGAALGFLAFNKYPAKMFMGNTGSLALGGALGATAFVTGTIWLLPFVGFIFYVEMFSAIAQVLWFQYTRWEYGEGRKLFERAPLHCHLMHLGWSERRVVWTFWAVNAVTTVVGLWRWRQGELTHYIF